MRSEQSTYPLEILSSLVEINIGKTPSRIKPIYWEGLHSWVAIADLKGDKFIELTKEAITDKGVQDSGIKIVAPNTIIFSFKLSIGKVAITKKALFTNEAIAAFPIKDRSKVDQSFLYYVLKNFNFTDGGDRAVMGKTLNKAKLKELKIPLPPLAEQQKIASILDAADSLRQKDQQLIEKYTALSQSLFLEMFGDPVSNPMGWDKVALGAIGKLDRGKSKHRPRNAPELLDGKHPLIQTGDIANCGGYIRKFDSTYSDIGLAQSKLWKAGTLCITIAANIAKTGILTFDACFPDSVVGFIPNEKSDKEYVRYWLSFLQKTLEDSAPMAAQKNINLKILRELELPLPPIKLQNQFAERIQLIEAQKQQAQTSLQKSAALFNSLLQRAFKGELTA